RHLGLVFVELCELLARPLPRFLERITIDGLEHVEAVMATHGRALALSAHLGNWELLSAAHRLSPYHLAVVIRPLDSPALNAVVELTARCTSTIEAAIRQTPEQWLWMHNRWRTQPPGG